MPRPQPCKATREGRARKYGKGRTGLRTGWVDWNVTGLATGSALGTPAFLGVLLGSDQITAPLLSFRARHGGKAVAARPSNRREGWDGVRGSLSSLVGAAKGVDGSVRG